MKFIVIGDRGDFMGSRDYFYRGIERMTDELPDILTEDERR